MFRSIFSTPAMLIVTIAVVAIVAIVIVAVRRRATSPRRVIQPAFRQYQQPFPTNPARPPAPANPYAGYSYATARQLGGAHAQPRAASWGPGNPYGSVADAISC